jgi:hypothetical protein
LKKEKGVEVQPRKENHLEKEIKKMVVFQKKLKQIKWMVVMTLQYIQQ